MRGGLMSDRHQKNFHVKSVINKDKNEYVVSISVVQVDKPRFSTLHMMSF